MDDAAAVSYTHLDVYKRQTYGNMKRVNWVITDWYRPDAYYESGKWRATWKYDGGGTRS